MSTPRTPSQRSAAPPVSATDRLSRLLAMVPYLVSRQGVPLADAATEFGITESQLVKDLELLFVCGTPGHMPDDLIDVDWEDGRVFLTNADTIARPLRLGVDEALALLVGLRALADVRRALEGGRRVHLTYFVPSRDETTERDVDPMRVLLVDGRWYLEGWCRRAEDVRLFRMDRVDALTVLVEHLDRFLAVASLVDAIARTGQRQGKQLPHRGFVLHEQNRFSKVRCRRRIGSDPVGQLVRLTTEHGKPH